MNGRAWLPVLAAAAESTVSLVVGVLGLIVTLGGFSLTLWQLRRTQRAAEAAEQSIRLAEGRFISNHLLVLLPQLQRVENDLHEAIKSDNSDFAMAHLGTWRWQAAQLHALLKRTNFEDVAFLVTLQDSVTLASDAKAALLESGGAVVNVTKRVREGIAEVTNRLGGLMIQLSINSKGDGDADSGR